MGHGDYVWRRMLWGLAQTDEREREQGCLREHLRGTSVLSRHYLGVHRTSLMPPRTATARAADLSLSSPSQPVSNEPFPLGATGAASGCATAAAAARTICDVRLADARAMATEASFSDSCRCAHINLSPNSNRSAGDTCWELWRPKRAAKSPFEVRATLKMSGSYLATTRTEVVGCPFINQGSSWAEFGVWLI